MHDRLAVHIIYTFAYLPNEENAVTLSQREVIGNDSLKELSACDAGIGYQLINSMESICKPQTSDRSDREAANLASL